VEGCLGPQETAAKERRSALAQSAHTVDFNNLNDRAKSGDEVAEAGALEMT